MLNIAIDGPSGAGKSTVAKEIARIMKIIYLDTGAMYRGVAYYALKNGIAVDDAPAVETMLKNFEMDIVYNENGEQEILVNGENVTPFLREHHMSKAASDISKLTSVRYKLVELQREFAKTHDVVLDGRDIGTFVLPDANCKFFLIASAEERATRRFIELNEKGNHMSYETILNDIIQRDHNDSTRAVAPLKQADDAILVDSTYMTADDVVKEIIDISADKLLK